MTLSDKLDSFGTALYESILPKKLRSSLESFFERVSDDRLITWDKKTIIFLLGTCAVFALFVSLNLSGSSIEKWNQYVTDSTKTASTQPILGKAKWIRFDEWCLGTPCFRSQSLHGFPSKNPALGFGNSPVILGTPVYDIACYIKPQLWGYFLFSFERGFSFFWYYKTFGILLSAFLLLKIITRNNFWLSVVGATWILFTSYVQWWFAAPGSDLMVAAFMMSVAGAYLLLSRSTIVLLLSSIVLTIFTTTFVLVLYPPYQVCLGYFVLFFLGAHLWRTYSRDLLRDKMAIRVACIGLMFAATGAIVYHFLDSCRESIQVMAQTEYPGNRISFGGTVSLEKYFVGYFDYLFTETHLPSLWGNPCEASNFILLYPIVFVSMIFDKFRGRKLAAFDIVMLSYIAFVSIWVLFGYPEFIAKITAFNRVRENRAFIGIGIANVFLVIHYLSAKMSGSTAAAVASDSASEAKKKKKKASRDAAVSNMKSPVLVYVGAALIVILCFVAIYSFGQSFNAQTKNFLTKSQIITVASGVAAVGLFIFLRSGLLFSVVVLGLCLSSNFLINPIAKGMPALTDKELMRVVTDIRQKDPEAKWISYGSNIIGNYLIAAGVNVLSGTKFIPDLELMKNFDPSGTNIKTYNRFAHVHLLQNFESPLPDSIRFILDNEDAFTMLVSPRAQALKNIGVKYILSNRVFRHEDIPYFESMYDFGVNGMYLYKRRDSVLNSAQAVMSTMKAITSTTQYTIDEVRMNPNTEHDAFVVVGNAFETQSGELPGSVYALVNGELIEAKIGAEAGGQTGGPKKSAFRLVLPFSRIGSGHIEFKMVIFDKNKRSYFIGSQTLAAELS